MDKFLSLLNSGDPTAILLIVVAVICIALFCMLALLNSKPAKQYEANKRHDHMRRNVIVKIAGWDDDLTED